MKQNYLLFFLALCLFPLPVYANPSLSFIELGGVHFLWVVPLEALVIWGGIRRWTDETVSFLYLVFISAGANFITTIMGILIPLYYFDKYTVYLWNVLSIAFVFTVLIEARLHRRALDHRRAEVPGLTVLFLVWGAHLVSFSALIFFIPQQFGIHGRGANESGAIGKMRTLVTAEQQFRILKKKVVSNSEETFPVFATFEELEKEGMVEFSGKYPHHDKKYLYLLKFQDRRRKFEIYAFPKTRENGIRDFFAETSGRVTFTTGSRLPSSQSHSVD